MDKILARVRRRRAAIRSGSGSCQRGWAPPRQRLTVADGVLLRESLPAFEPSVDELQRTGYDDLRQEGGGRDATQKAGRRRKRLGQFASWRELAAPFGEQPQVSIDREGCDRCFDFYCDVKYMAAIDRSFV